MLIISGGRRYIATLIVYFFWVRKRDYSNYRRTFQAGRDPAAQAPFGHGTAVWPTVQEPEKGFEPLAPAYKAGALTS